MAKSLVCFIVWWMSNGKKLTERHLVDNTAAMRMRVFFMRPLRFLIFKILSERIPSDWIIFVDVNKWIMLDRPHVKKIGCMQFLSQETGQCLRFTVIQSYWFISLYNRCMLVSFAENARLGKVMISLKIVFPPNPEPIHIWFQLRFLTPFPRSKHSWSWASTL